MQADLIRKHLRDLPATAKGRMHRPRKGLRSTRSNKKKGRSKGEVGRKKWQCTATVHYPGGRKTWGHEQHFLLCSISRQTKWHDVHQCHHSPPHCQPQTKSILFFGIWLRHQSNIFNSNQKFERQVNNCSIRPDLHRPNKQMIKVNLQCHGQSSNNTPQGISRRRKLYLAICRTKKITESTQQNEPSKPSRIMSSAAFAPHTWISLSNYGTNLPSKSSLHWIFSAHPALTHLSQYTINYTAIVLIRTSGWPMAPLGMRAVLLVYLTTR